MVVKLDLVYPVMFEVLVTFSVTVFYLSMCFSKNMQFILGCGNMTLSKHSITRDDKFVGSCWSRGITVFRFFNNSSL